jgi:Xaa-Pro aminopeptidase
VDGTALISAGTLAGRRARFQKQLGDGLAIVPGNKLVRRSADSHFTFRQSSDLLYLTGWPQPEVVAVFERDRFILFVQPRDPLAETWNGRRPGLEGARERYGADEAYPIGEFADRLPELLANVPTLYHRFGADEALDKQVLEAMATVRTRWRMGVAPPDQILDPYGILHEMRLLKEPEELACMRASAAIARDGHHAAARATKPGAWEYQIEAELYRAFRGLGGWGPAYPSIVASGDNATILHYTENNRQMQSGELLLIDAGAEYEGYASDVTRTYPVSGKLEGAPLAVYEAVLRAQDQAIAAVKPGATIDGIHQVAVRALVEGMLELGALEGSIEGVLASESYRAFYMHRTGHFLGIDVHDVGQYSVGGVPRPLEPGMVITVEPGLYFGPEEPRTPAHLSGIGVRIEDDVLVTERGCEVLTHDIPKRPADVEAWMRETRE